MWGDATLDSILEDDSLAEQKLKEINEAMIRKTIDISDLVEGLGPALTSPNAQLRSRSTLFLSKTLTSLPEDLLSEPQLNLISSFYADRIKDHHSVLPNVLLGILSISRMKNLAAGNCTTLSNAIFMNVPCQTQLRDDRSNIYEIIKVMGERHSEELKKIGPDYVYGVISAIEGERDPRNLMFLFTYMPQFMRLFPLGHLADEMFETFECYFPIDFHPTQTDPASITREKLAHELAFCLTGNENFVEKCLELALEKLDSDLIVAKLDSLELLSRAAERFDATKIEQHFDKIWSALRVEVLPGSTKEITYAALYTIVRLVDAASNSNQTTENFLKIMFDSMVMQLSDIKSRLFQPSITVVFKLLTSKNAFSSIWVTNRTVPILLIQLNSEEQHTADETCSILDYIDRIMSSCLANHFDDKIDQQYISDYQRILVENIDVDDKKLQQKSYDCLKNVARIVNADNRMKIYAKFNKILQFENDSININPCLLELAALHPEEVFNMIVSNLIGADLEKTIIEKKNVEKIYEIVCALTSIPFFTNSTISYIFSEIFTKKNTKVLGIFARCISAAEFNDQIKFSLYKDHKMIDRFLEFVRSDSVDMTSLIDVKNILCIIVRALSVEEQNTVIKMYLPKLDMKNSNDFYIATGILSHSSHLSCDSVDFETVVNDLVDIALNTEDVQIREISHHLLCGLFNKVSPENSGHQSILKKVVEYLKDEIKKHKEKAVEILSWISKGLLMQGHADAAQIVSDLADLLNHPKLSTAAVLAFEIISVEFPQLHLPVVKMFFKQKLFQIVLKKIINGVESLSEKHLTALSFVLKITPHVVLKSNLTKIGPILFKCLEIESTKAIEISLEIICKFIEENDEYFKDHLQYLIPQFIKLSQFKNSMNIRIAALKSLKDVTKYPIVVLLPYKHDVVYGLIPALDDHKRLVRNAAVEARTIWFLIGSSAGGD